MIMFQKFCAILVQKLDVILFQNSSMTILKSEPLTDFSLKHYFNKFPCYLFFPTKIQFFPFIFMASLFDKITSLKSSSISYLTNSSSCHFLEFTLVWTTSTFDLLSKISNHASSCEASCSLSFCIFKHRSSFLSCSFCDSF